MTTPIFVQAIPQRLPNAFGARYRIERPLGGWGMAEAYVARDALLGRAVVVKVLSPALADGLDVDRFRREVAAASALQHPNVLSILDCGMVDELPFYTMPLVPGESLRVRLVSGTMAIADTVAVLRDVARALGAAHSHGFAHHDVRPDHVFCTAGIAQLTDLGLARALLESSKRPASSLARTGIAVSTPAYMSPEQANGEPAGTRADWYAFGVMAFEMLTGRLPFLASSESGMLVAQVSETPPGVHALRDDVPESLGTMVNQLLVKDPARRLHGRDNVLRFLDDALSGARADEHAAWQPPPREAPTPLSPMLEAASRGRPSGEMRAIPARTPHRPQITVRKTPRGERPVRTSPRGEQSVAATDPGAWRARAVKWAASLAVVAASAFGIGSLFRDDGLAPPVEADASETNVTVGGMTGAKSVYLVALPEADARWRALLTSARTTLRMSLPGATPLSVMQADNALPDTSSMRRLTGERAAITAAITRAAMGDSSELSLLLMTDSSTITCAIHRTLPRNADTLAHLNDLAQRAVGALAFRYNRELQARLLGGVTISDVRNLCRQDRFDAMQLLARARAESKRPTQQRLADLDHALQLDSAYLEAKLERAKLLGYPSPTTGLAPSVAVPAGTIAPTPSPAPSTASTNIVPSDAIGSSRVVTRVEVAILNQIARDPNGAINAARSAGAMGQISATVWAMAALGAGHPKEALDVLDRLGTKIDTVAGAPMGADIKTAIRTDAQYMMGHDTFAMATVLPVIPASPQMLSGVAYPVAAALGDTAHWNTLFAESKLASPGDRIAALLLSADVASMSGRDAVAQRWYQRAVSEGEPLLRVGKPLPNTIIAVAMARRRARNFAGADALLAPLETHRDPDVARAARLARALIAVDLRNETAIASAERWMTDDVKRNKHWDSALALARLHALRGNATTAVQYLRTALSLGMPRLQRTTTARLGDLRAEPDLRSLLAVPDGRALLLPAD